MLKRLNPYALSWVVITTVSAIAMAEPTAPPDATKLEFFEKEVRPVFANRCYNCHSADNKAAGGLRVDDRNGLLSGGERGPGVVPGNPEESWIWKAINHADPKLKMPPDEKLTQQEIDVLTTWIRNGAAWPALEIPANLLKGDADYEPLRKEHWAWQPLRNAEVPQVQGDWPKDDLDRFILAKLNEKGLKPAADAGKVALIRRLSFDLTGLPPTQELIVEFLLDDSPQAVEHVVDRLLASPTFGERWGRHWLDVARYGESTAGSRNLPYPHAWRYRDYVIDSFNKDKPYDQFVQEQIAGDLLPANSPAQKTEQLIATGFLGLGVKDVNQRFEVRFVMDNVDEQIDTVSRSVLALTVSCARCHDHKFDPVPTKDYYALAGIFKSTESCDGLRSQMGGGGLAYYVPDRLIPLGESKGPDPQTEEQIKTLKEEVLIARTTFTDFRDQLKEENAGPDRDEKLQELRQAWQTKQAELVALTDPAKQGPVALGVREGKTVGDTEVRIRGEAEKLGPVVPRGYLSVLEVPNAAPVNPRQSGRLELAYWLTSPENPLASRVAVNRVWKHLFGEGLVSTVDNFGVTGDKPSHPELLDYLAANFAKDGWSTKKLIRSIVLSRTYQLGSDANEEYLKIDPANRLVWRHTPRRLDAEEIRDAMLAASGKLDAQRPQGSPAQTFLVRELRNDGPEAKALRSAAAASFHRSVYLPLLRGIVPHSLGIFDFAEQGLVTGKRDATTIAPQSLYMLNDAFVLKQSSAFAESLLANESISDEERLRRVYLLALGRKAAQEELDRARNYLNEYALAAAEIPTPQQPVTANKTESPAGGEASAASASQTPVATPAPAASPDPAATPTPLAKQEESLKKKKKGPAIVNPDQLPRGNEVLEEEVVVYANPRTAAWASLIQAVYGSAEFRYLR